MLPNINFRSLVVIIVLCLALSIRMLPIVAPATSSFASIRIIDSNGSRIPYIYYGLKPNVKFASQLGLISGRKRILEQPSFEFRILKYRPTEDVGCKLLPAALRIPAAPNPPGCPCNGQYMEPQYFDCDQGCGGTVWEEFVSNGGYPECSGYYFDDTIIGDCNGCELAERACNSCRC